MKNTFLLAPVMILAALTACTSRPTDEFDPEATYVGGDSVCAEFAEFLPNITQSSIFESEVREQAEELRDRAQNAKPAIRRASEEFLRSLSFEGQMALPNVMQRIRDACNDAGYPFE